MRPLVVSVLSNGLLLLTLSLFVVVFIRADQDLTQERVALANVTADLNVAQQEAARYKDSRQKLLAQNAGTERSLSKKSEQLEDVVERNSVLDRDVDRLLAALEDLEHEYSKVTTARDVARRENLGYVSENRFLRSEVSALTYDLELSGAERSELLNANELQASDIAALRASNDGLSATNRLIERDKSDLESKLGERNAQNSRLNQELEDIRNEQEALLQQLGTVEQLENKAAALRAEIVELEDRRKPLLLDTSVRNFRCTGSMEPDVTCLDSATYLDNFRPEDIVVGTVIAFRPVPSCRLSGPSISHRVIKIKVEKGIHYFWTKGDANARADGCWIPESNVGGYITQIHKNTWPQNASLRVHVNRAKAELDEALREYLFKYKQYCVKDGHGKCSFSVHQIDELHRLHYRYVLSVELYSCWVNSARTARTPTDDGPTVFVKCMKP